MVCNKIIDQIIKRRRLQSYWFQMHFDISKKVLDDNLPDVERTLRFDVSKEIMQKESTYQMFNKIPIDLTYWLYNRP